MLNIRQHAQDRNAHRFGFTCALCVSVSFHMDGITSETERNHA
jgi:hypothetical protein